MVKVEETTHKFPDGKEVYVKKWTPDTEPVAKLIFVHGFSDHVNRYIELFPTLASRGISVFGWDQRGWGRSALKKSDWGLTGHTAQVLADIANIIETEMPSSPVPLFVMGHSMGGGQLLTLASDPSYEHLTSKIRGILLEAPYVALVPSQVPSAFTEWAGRLAGKILPKKQMWAGLPPENMSRDPAIWASLKADTLCHDTGTLQGLAGMLDRASNLEHGKVHLNKGIQSLWLAHGSGDGTISYPASKKWYEMQAGGVPDKEFKTYEGWQHQLHADLPETQPVFAKDVGDWILARSGNDGKSVGLEQSKL